MIDYQIEVYEKVGSLRRLVRIVAYHETLCCWHVHYPPTRSLGRRIEHIFGTRFPVSDDAMWALRRAYPHRSFDPIVIPLSPPASTPSVRHEPGNTIPGGNGSWVRVAVDHTRRVQPSPAASDTNGSL